MRELVCPRHMCKVPLGKCMEWDIDEVTGERIQCNEKPVMSTTLYWCKQCNVPIYEESCPLCGEKGKYIATDIRPVFLADLFKQMRTDIMKLQMRQLVLYRNIKKDIP